MNLQTTLLIGYCACLAGCCTSAPVCETTPSTGDLIFPTLAASWDEGIPLGNGTLGALVWQRDSFLRLSLDRTDLWDLRPSDSLSGPNNRFARVKEHIRSRNYRPVQQKFDWPYDRTAAPSKIPGAALEFPLNELGQPVHVRLYLNEALCDVAWPDGTELQTFVHATHTAFWEAYWDASTVQLPDSVLQKQYDNEMYKFGAAAREKAYPISLQAVWTADNGKLPPWKGDYHHDLNTQLGYWPAYAGNHLTEGLGYLNTLWVQRDTYKRYTRQYFGTEGMNVPGVCTLTGEPMGGWIQYSMSQTTGAWLAQHFYLH